MISFDDAKRCLDTAFPGEGVTAERTTNGVFKVTHPVKGQLAAAYNLQAAVALACRPFVTTQVKARQQKFEEDKETLTLFMLFIQEKFDAEFQQWRAERAADQLATRQSSGTEPDPKRLVSLVSP